MKEQQALHNLAEPPAGPLVDACNARQLLQYRDPEAADLEKQDYSGGQTSQYLEEWTLSVPGKEMGQEL